MIQVEWHDPNFAFVAREKGGRRRRITAFCYARTKNDLIKSLDRRGLEVRAEDIAPYDFTDWLNRAELAKRDAVRQYKAGIRPIEFDEDLWGELKFHLFELFNGKCAYCESNVQHIDFGDVDHYRPKKKVKEDPRKGTDPGHPGYYWLAYYTLNLLPACGLCNKPPGKGAQFPVLGTHSRTPKALDDEQPLLLNPYNNNINPLEHLEFNEKGAAIERNGSQFGKNSELIFRLNRPYIGEKRRTAMIKVQTDWSTMTSLYSSYYKGDELERQRKKYRLDVAMGHREYSAAQLCELERITKRGGT
jgi:hypothetical protein